MFSKRIKRSTVFLANGTKGFMNWVKRGPHMIYQVLYLVELPEASCTLMPVSQDFLLKKMIKYHKKFCKTEREKKINLEVSSEWSIFWSNKQILLWANCLEIILKSLMWENGCKGKLFYSENFGNGGQALFGVLWIFFRVYNTVYSNGVTKSLGPP